MNIIRLIKENKPYPRADESVLHYLVCTENRDFESALRCLRMAVREWHGISRLALGVSSATFLVSLLSAASGVGAWVSLALVSTVFSGSQAWGSRKESQVREKELELLKSNPELLELMHQAYCKGVPPLKLVHSYNALVGAFDTESGTCQGTMPVQAFAGQMQGAIATAKEVHQALGQLDVGSLPESGLYPHLANSKPSLPPIQPAQLPAQLQDKPVEAVEPTPSAEPTVSARNKQREQEFVDLIRQMKPVPIPQNKDELLQALRQQCPAVLSLVKSHPIRCVGVQRSGKTTLVKKLALLRLVLLPEHRVIASTPHYEPTNSYPEVFQIVGIRNGKRDYPAIRREWHALAQRVEDGRVSSITTIWDEFGLMDQVMEEEILTSVLTSCLRETMKFGEYPVFIVHGETQAFLPGSKGLVTVFLNGTVRVETVGEKVIGTDGLETIKPTGKFKVQWLDGSREEGKIPDWLTEELLIGMLPETTAASNRD